MVGWVYVEGIVPVFVFLRSSGGFGLVSAWLDPVVIVLARSVSCPYILYRIMHRLVDLPMYTVLSASDTRRGSEGCHARVRATARLRCRKPDRDSSQPLSSVQRVFLAFPRWTQRPLNSEVQLRFRLSNVLPSRVIWQTMLKRLPTFKTIPQAIGLPFLSSQEDAQLKFRSGDNGIKRLYGDEVVPMSDVAYWAQYYDLFNSAADVSSLISAQDSE